MIIPTVGRIVWFFEVKNDVKQPEQAAIITAVWNNTLINVNVFSTNGPVREERSIELVQPNSEKASIEQWCEWMPYQTKKATGSESGEKAAGTQVI